MASAFSVSEDNNYHLRRALYFRDETQEEILAAVRSELLRSDQAGGRRVSIRFRSASALERFREEKLRGMRTMLREVNTLLRHPVRFTSGRTGSYFYTCDLFFEECAPDEN